MRTIFKIILLFTVMFTVTSCCKEDVKTKAVAEIDKLPPATQTGANTFGCLLNGKAFLPGNYNNATNCFYQYVNGEYYFSVNVNNINQDDYLISVGVGTYDKEIAQNNTYVLEEMIPSNAYGTYALEGIPTRTNNTYTGELKITKLDSVNHIVSGTFWFDILDFQGNVHQIREGRFDMQYTN